MRQSLIWLVSRPKCVLSFHCSI